jgi:hypothetical protein
MMGGLKDDCGECLKYNHMPKTRTKEEIKLQIDGLKKERATLPEKSRFGDENWRRIDAQISILEGTHDKDEFWNDESDEDYQDGDNDIYFAAEIAEMWLDGDTDENLFGE